VGGAFEEAGSKGGVLYSTARLWRRRFKVEGQQGGPEGHLPQLLQGQALGPRLQGAASVRLSAHGARRH
jgi:hypothetical protein